MGRECGIVIDKKYRLNAAKAADSMRQALLAVEDCGGDVELTRIVANLANDRYKLCSLFGLNPAQAFQVERLDKYDADSVD